MAGEKSPIEPVRFPTAGDNRPQLWDQFAAYRNPLFDQIKQPPIDTTEAEGDSTEKPR